MVMFPEPEDGDKKRAKKPVEDNPLLSALKGLTADQRNDIADTFNTLIDSASTLRNILEKAMQLAVEADQNQLLPLVPQIDNKLFAAQRVITALLLMADTLAFVCAPPDGCGEPD